MNRRAHRIGRGLTCLGLLSTAEYLGWRLCDVAERPPVWLVALAFAVEIAGFVGSGVLMWALWHRRHRPTTQPRRTGPNRFLSTSSYASMNNRSTRSGPHCCRCRRCRPSNVVVDIGARPEVVALAVEFGAVYAATDSRTTTA